MFTLVNYLLRNLWLIARWGGRALSVCFEVFWRWIDHALDEMLRRKWEVLTDGVGVPTIYSLLNGGSVTPHPVVALWRATALTLTCDDCALTTVRQPSPHPSSKFLGGPNLSSPENRVSRQERCELTIIEFDFNNICGL